MITPPIWLKQLITPTGKLRFEEGRKSARQSLDNGQDKEALIEQAIGDCEPDQFTRGWLTELGYYKHEDLVKLAEKNQPEHDRRLKWQSFEDWSEEGYVIIKGENSTIINGEQQFSSRQVKKKGSTFYDDYDYDPEYDDYGMDARDFF